MRKKNGFSLIELLIALAIIGILAAIAYPSYVDSVRKSNRSDAIGELNDLSVRLQRCYTTYSTFAPEDGRCDIIDLLKTSDGVKSKGGFYVITGSSFGKTTFTLTAAPVSGKTQAKDYSCASFSLDHKGTKIAKNSDGTETTDECW